MTSETTSNTSSPYYGEEPIMDRGLVIPGEEPYTAVHRAPPQRNLVWEGEAAYSTTTLVQREVGRLTRKITTIEPGRFKRFDFDPITQTYKPYLIDLTSLNIGEIPDFLLKYNDIAYLDLMYNKITNSGLENLKGFPYLITLMLDHNKLTSTSLPLMPTLTYLSFNKNYVKTITPINQPKLKYLFINENKIQYLRNLDSKSIPSIHIISICHNELLSMNTRYAITLRKLYLSYNQITKIDGISKLPNLKWLNLRGNEIDSISGFSKTLSKLYYVNLRENDITNEGELKRIKILPKLRILILTGNPLDQSKGKALRGMILKINPDMRRINKFLVDEEEEEEARRLIAEEEKERERLRAEFGEDEGGEIAFE